MHCNRKEELSIWAKRLERSIGIIKNIRNWTTVFEDYLGFKKQKYFYLMRNGARIQVRGGTTDKAIIMETWIDRAYFQGGFDILENDTIIDIGAQIGSFSVLASLLANNGRIFSYEPVPANYDLLTTNIQVNNIKNILAVNKAVTGTIEERYIYLSDDDVGGHSFDSDRVEQLREQGHQFSKKICNYSAMPSKSL